jgi:cytochrome c-type biogenesis protein CcmE
MNKYWKFGIPTVAILATLGWLAFDGISGSTNYYKNVKEVTQMGESAKDKRIRLGGDVVSNSIVREGKQVHFKLTWEGVEMKVVYAGTEPLPDTFKDGAQALADGRLLADGTFQANKIQAKCASKYEAKPKLMTPAQSTHTSQS